MRRTLIIVVLAGLLLGDRLPADSTRHQRTADGADAPVINIFRFKKDDQIDARRATMPWHALRRRTRDPTSATAGHRTRAGTAIAPGHDAR
jgi:hypothetical protein